jgi:predicted GH43/DUF377 family glycosyl hydrolase
MERFRSILAEPPVTPERLNDGRPVLEPVGGHAWESRVVLNPAAVFLPAKSGRVDMPEALEVGGEEQRRLDSSGGAWILLYRAQGTEDLDLGVAPSSVGLALMTADFELVARQSAPVISPGRAYDLYGVEDPRATMVGSVCHLLYTGYAPADGRAGGSVQICLATSADFVTWSLGGPVRVDVNVFDNKNAALLPRKVSGDWKLLHRPMAGAGAMAIHLAESADPRGPWKSSGTLMKSYRYREFERSWIGAGGPPVPLDDDRFLMIYHLGHFAPDGSREYDLAAALLDFRRQDPVVSRIEPLMRPQGELERTGDPDVGVDNVLFSCANDVVGTDLVIPYAGADSRIFAARVPMVDLVSALEAAAP